LQDVTAFIKDSLGKGWTVEAGILDRLTNRESRFRLLTEAELSEVIARYR
jgi:proteasome alpha subunit